MGKVVCVTGASGYVASWLVKLLLDADYTVKGTVRNINDTNRFEHLKALEGAKERLHLFQANLIEDGSFDSIIDGCDGIFHTASPVLPSHSITNLQKELLEPAIQGTLNVLKSCTKSTSVKRVVLTSSMSAVNCNSIDQASNIVLDETWFSDPDYCQEKKMWYSLSKTLAEEAAWKFAKANGIDLVVMNPGFVLGPLLQPHLNATSQYFSGVIKGIKALSQNIFVDVRDVAHAHILAFENPSASGRYLLVEASMCPNEVQQRLHSLYPTLTPPCKGETSPTYQVSKTKARSLGIDFIPFDVSLKETVESLIERNFIQLLN